MTAAQVADAVRQSVTVQVPIERAFAVFTERMGGWWPPDHHIGDQPFTDVFIERSPGGRWGERDADGNECAWGYVLAYEAPARIALSWGLQPENWEYDDTRAKHSEIEVTFTAEGEGTRVELTHRKFDAHGDGAADMRGAVGSPNGWGQGMRRYAEFVESGSAA